MKKMNNKGFSLVELIVVVLIMAIIAVALAPQVMKWVENSRQSTDMQNFDSIYGAVSAAVVEEAVYGEIPAGGYNITFDETGVSLDAAYSNMNTQLQQILGTNYKTELKTKSKDYQGDYIIGISKDATTKVVKFSKSYPAGLPGAPASTSGSTS